MKAMQESCMWLTRATALQHEQEIGGIKGGEVVIDDAPKEHQRTIGEALEKYQSGERIHIKNRPTIIIKKK
jgi:hypothetical protein